MVPRLGHLAGAAGLVASLLSATLAWAETRPPAPPPSPAGHGVAPPKGVKWEGPDYDATKNRTPAKGKGFTLPEVDDEVLRKSGRKGQ